MHDALSAELEAALLRALRAAYENESWSRFGSQLRAPVIALVESATQLGRWVSASRRIELARNFVLDQPWPKVVGVLAHEMAHQFVDEVLRVRDETAHGETFRRVCAERGIDGRAAGAPDAAPDVEADRVLDRIRKLLALAGSSNQHEAEMAMRKAHELMLRHNVESTAKREYEVRHLGSGARISRVEADIAGLLSECFFVKVIQIPIYVPRTGKLGNVFEVVGTRANVDMAAHVYEFLLATAQRLWRDNRDDARVKSGRDRLAYQSGVVRGFREKLVRERVELKGTGLIWVGDRKLDDYYRARHPRITMRRRSVRINGAHNAGREAGRSVVLHKPVEHGPSGGPRRLLRG